MYKDEKKILIGMIPFLKKKSKLIKILLIMKTLKLVLIVKTASLLNF